MSVVSTCVIVYNVTPSAKLQLHYNTHSLNTLTCVSAGVYLVSACVYSVTIAAVNDLPC